MITFLQWWRSGLALPWQRFAGASIMVSYESSQWRLLPANKPIEASVLVGKDIFLLAPQEKIIQAKIPASEQGKSLSQISAGLLPFSVDELYFASDAEKTNLFACLKTDLPSVELSLAGVVFESDSQYYLSQPQGSAVDRAWPSTNQLLSVVGLAILALCVFGMVAWQMQERKQVELLDTINLIKSNNPNQIKADKVLSSLRQTLAINSPDAVAASNILSALWQAMPLGSEVQQLMLIEGELIIDVTAINAAELKADLDRSNVFASTEFVTVISTNANGNSERFRLKAKLKSASSEREFNEPLVQAPKEAR